MLPLLLPSLLELIVYYPSIATAQGTDAICSESWRWANNALGQSPCLVSSWLETPCWGSSESFIYGDVSEAWPFWGPSDPTESTPCDCNTVLYSALQACALCQGLQNYSWFEYNFECDFASSIFPERIPNGTVVPDWAYMNITALGTFDVASAMKIAATATSKMPASITSAISSSSTSVGTVTTSPGTSSVARPSASPATGGHAVTQPDGSFDPFYPSNVIVRPYTYPESSLGPTVGRYGYNLKPEIH
ncbi:uncharacterized protein BXZ73DRAFT_98198 [Epithele typhae]|uniref:uncharacterized protein n=1 Tax=Epithele typhae TaxID=378194 RepID=UPI002008D68D|nr:uncharacterized protein BXZ73DRAFT_98198 [Epithele typhae]KAH9941808.1 hypothetical protein BXZ73DRAFT_98198 [Epithele typhae]